MKSFLIITLFVSLAFSQISKVVLYPTDFDASVGMKEDTMRLINGFTVKPILLGRFSNPSSAPADSEVLQAVSCKIYPAHFSIMIYQFSSSTVASTYINELYRPSTDTVSMTYFGGRPPNYYSTFNFIRVHYAFISLPRYGCTAKVLNSFVQYKNYLISVNEYTDKFCGLTANNGTMLDLLLTTFIKKINQSPITNPVFKQYSNKLNKSTEYYNIRGQKFDAAFAEKRRNRRSITCITVSPGL